MEEDVWLGFGVKRTLQRRERKSFGRNPKLIKSDEEEKLTEGGTSSLRDIFKNTTRVLF